MHKKTQADVAAIDISKNAIEGVREETKTAITTSFAFDFDFWKGKLKGMFSRTVSK